ncbi:MAG: bifunctional response regulator/alkaline phosphatase family protein [Bacteroidales bacterium]|nr:bifunctional response regulator/alkaline phosphatase family protein [Bacteroidales bacterium]
MQTMILWADDEIELLKPHILFLKEKGCDVVPVQSGSDALDELDEGCRPDIVFLDEQMPGLSGIETLGRIKEKWPQLPVVMITKSEEEHIMEDALGGKISDYLIKPVNPNQIWLTVKKHTERKRLQSERSTMNYQQRFREIGMQLGGRLSAEEWVEIYKQLVYWELELSGTEDENIHEIFLSQKREANQQFCRFYENNYLDWLAGGEGKPLLSPTVLKERLFPLLGETQHGTSHQKPTFLIVIDNFRYDQWKMVQPLLEQYFRTERDDIYYTIIPTTTQFARNAMFAGLMPSEIEKKYPQYWVNEDEEGWKNQYEAELLQENLRRHGLGVKMSYNKVLNAQYGHKLVERVPELMHNGLNVIIYNFIDMLSHARTDSDIVRELAVDEKAYRSLTLSWMEHSPLLEILKELSERDVNVIITTDHGSVKIDHPVKVRGDRDISVNLRYKQGRLLDYNAKEVFEVKDPAKLFLPRRHVTSPYIFCHGSDFFAYPNNYNEYVRYYTGTFQHGGVSMEEVMVPFVKLVKR